MATATLTPHARRQAEVRGIPAEVVAEVVSERVGRRASPAGGLAVFCGWAEDGWRGSSNGDQVWAILRGGQVVTVMFRRGDQPATPAALRVQEVLR